MSEQQSKIDSAMEVVTNTAIGFAVAMVGNHIILPFMLDIELKASTNFWIAVGYTGLSIGRQWVIRRAFNGRSPWSAIKARWERPLYYPHPAVLD
jgi:hypothetical protein